MCSCGCGCLISDAGGGPWVGACGGVTVRAAVAVVAVVVTVAVLSIRGYGRGDRVCCVRVGVCGKGRGVVGLWRRGVGVR